MRRIDADALKYKNLAEVNGKLTHVLTAEEINNAETVEPEEVYMTAKDYNLYLEGYKQGRKDFGRPQGECKSCRHRDPEDKKCDCGGQERQGCPFPVSDDYYCKYYERGEE